MDSISGAASTSRFRFRDHHYDNMAADADSSQGHTDTEYSSSIMSSTESDAGVVELQSMTAKGVKNLCTELLELKTESDEDFQKNVFNNYISFLGISEGVKNMESELRQLKFTASTQKKFIQDLTNMISAHDLAEKTMRLVSPETLLSQRPFPGILEAHTEDVSEILDTLLSEHRLDEAIRVLQSEAESFQGMQSEGNFSSDEMMLYNTAISERRAMLVDQLALIGENPRVSPPELQKALVGLCKLGETHLATELLFKYYHSRIAYGLCNMHSSKEFLHGLHVQNAAKYVFSMISQAARSYSALHGETSSYPLELIQWASEETEIFAACFNKYVKSTSETTSGLSTAVEAVHFAMSYCSLLETQKINLLPYLIKHIRPCMEEILQIHIDHYKNVIGIFTSTDAWMLGKYLVSGILTKGNCFTSIGQHPEYCLLTSSGWKFITIFQAVAEDISPLVALQMEGSVLRGLMDIFTKYITILEGALTSDVTAGERAIRTVPLVERVSIVANLATVLQFFSSIIEDICGGFYNLRFEIKSYELHIQDTYARLRSHFFQQFIHRFLSPEADNKNVLHSCPGSQDDSNSCYLEPSACYQELYLELRKLQKFSEDNHVEDEWLIDLLRELMEAIFMLISSDNKFLAISEDLSMDQHCINFMQFVLDIQFLVEMARCGGYLFDDIMKASLEVVSHAETVFGSAGLNPKRHIKDEGWAASAASKALQKLQELEIKEALEPEIDGQLEEEISDPEPEYISNSSENDDATVSSKDSGEPDSADIDASEFSDDTRREISKEDFPPAEDVDVKRESAESSDPNKDTGTVEDDRDENESRTQENILQKPQLTGDNLEENSSLPEGTEQLM